jgi:uncharacterized protein YceK
MEPYGGVKICLEAGAAGLKNVREPSEDNKMISLLAGAYMVTIDMPLSAVADTLTLPWTVPAVLNGTAQTSPVDWTGTKKMSSLSEEDQSSSKNRSPQ